MMKLYAVRDVKADSFTALHPCANDAIARRSFMEAALDPRSELAKYPEDYQLYCVGAWEPNSGELTSEKTPKFICTAFEVIQVARDARKKHEPELPVHAEVK